MQITVAQCDWGEAQLQDIQMLLTNVDSHLTGLFREPTSGAIEVAATASTDDIPRTRYRPSPQSPFVILLQARGRKWAKFSYQFSHELCHVLSGYEELRENPNNWFHEALCELASVFTLRRMAEQWPTSPPYLNWAEYGGALFSYAEGLLSQEKRRLPVGTTLSTWLSSEEDSLRKDRYQRDKNAVVAYSLLPIFESEPAGWNAIRYLPNFSGMFKDYLSNWHSQVEPIDKSFVNRIIRHFEE